jgi:hypothetical protein
MNGEVDCSKRTDVNENYDGHYRSEVNLIKEHVPKESSEAVSNRSHSTNQG